MKFVEYDPVTFATVCYGHSSAEALAAAAEQGLPFVAIDDFPPDFALHLYDVDPETRRLYRSESPRPDPNAPPLPVEPVAPAPLPISDRQFYQQAAIAGYITKQDALAAVQTGFIPAPLQEIVDQIDNENERFNAEIVLSGATTFVRPHPLTEMIGAKFGLTSEQIDEFWIEAAKL